MWICLIEELTRGRSVYNGATQLVFTDVLLIDNAYSLSQTTEEIQLFEKITIKQ